MSRPALGDVLLGAAGAATGLLPDGVAAAGRLGLPAARAYCVVLVDGLGWANLHARADAAPFLSGGMDRLVRAESAIPSTTAANLAYLGTGALPGRTGMLGYSVRNPATGRGMNLVSWAGGPDPRRWQRVPTVFERLDADGAVSVSVGPWKFEGSPLTTAALRGAEYEAAETLADRVDRTLEVLREPDVSLVYLYWSEIDAIGHSLGWGGREWSAELGRVDAELARLAASLPAGTALVVTADHGMVDIPLGSSEVFGGPARIDISARAALWQGVELVAGEPRFVHAYAADAAGVASRWRGELGDRATVLTRAEAIAAGWFGEVDPRHEPALGDVIAAAHGDVCLVDSRSQSEASRSLVGMHGSIGEQERGIPVGLTLA
ncbi:phosphodiesterase [Pseudactinotalea sp. HY160]|uniref:alkaline phosphatase family protein n=1 Tax=Pseudactinotalea sp. HY160 TaxID=2654490 RepID=UPI00128DAA3C|nr:phosphodiesterase [Pseudactinotalea sp. HY160]